ncbi:hypothetical protein DPEC_G00202820 [Dallia pectoralis]|uniref:Uncharacterized protein n=1 Tax=Dallia pectoralis TaxID=75939 RepID=A0ACC2G9C4_DALPE|nr:hypothetical protein DPEC_G00202820 [Dallia pectoralis]
MVSPLCRRKRHSDARPRPRGAAVKHAGVAERWNASRGGREISESPGSSAGALMMASTCCFMATAGPVYSHLALWPRALTPRVSLSSSLTLHARPFCFLSLPLISARSTLSQRDRC